MKNSLAIFLFFFAIAGLNAQHNSLSIGDINHNILLNPALTGNYGFLSTSFSFRNEWLLDENHPRSIILSAHTPLKNENWNIGAVISNDAFGNVRQNSIQFFTAYKLKTSNGIMSFGAKSGFSNLTISNQDLVLIDNYDDVFEEKMSFFTMNFGIGIHFQSEKYYLGLSKPEMTNSSSYNLINSQSKVYWQKQFLCGYNYSFSDRLTLENHLSIRQIGFGKYLAQYIPLLSIDKTYYTGFLFRGGKSMGAIFRYQLNEKIKLGYNFDYNFIKNGPKSIGNHEIVLSYNFVELVETFNPKFF